MRIGFGYDLHALVAGRPLILGGVRVPYDRGLAGHSDADAVTHAICDALLGAAALGDIGNLFPDSDPQYKDADSLTMLREVAGRITTAGFTISNVDATIMAEQPRLAPHRDAMRRCLADAMGISVDAVSVKFTTNERMDAVGRGEAIAAHAVALLLRA